MKLSKRLDCVLALVEDNKSVIDIGCDHAYLAISIALNKNPKKVIASDNKIGPLNRAIENINKYNVNKIVIPKLGDGVDTIENDIDTIIITGMGGLNIVGILKYKKDLYKNVDTLIISPNNYLKEVRIELTKLGFYIKDEYLIKDNNIIYPIIVFKRGKKKYKMKEYIYGPILLNKKDKLFIEYLKELKNEKEKIYNLLPRKYVLKRLELKKDLKYINRLTK